MALGRAGGSPRPRAAPGAPRGCVRILSSSTGSASTTVLRTGSDSSVTVRPDMYEWSYFRIPRMAEMICDVLKVSYQSHALNLSAGISRSKDNN